MSRKHFVISLAAGVVVLLVSLATPAVAYATPSLVSTTSTSDETSSPSATEATTTTLTAARAIAPSIEPAVDHEASTVTERGVSEDHGPTEPLTIEPWSDGSQVSTPRVSPLGRAAVTPPDWYLPYESGQRWSSGGPHADSDGTVRGALDFSPGSSPNKRIVAIADGRVYRLTCPSGWYLGIDHGSGWKSEYYHLAGAQEHLIGRSVQAGTFLGEAGDTLPCGGSSDGPHVHLSILFGDAPQPDGLRPYYPVDGMRFGDYITRAGSAQHTGRWTTLSGATVFSNWGCCLISTTPVPTGTPFVDVSTSAASPLFSVFAGDIVWLADSGVSTGWVGADGRREYRPKSEVTRDVMAAFLYRLAGEPAYTPPASSPFSDVGADRTFYKEISWLSSSGISEGWTDGAHTEFRPLEPVSRDVMAAFLYRFAGGPVATPPVTSPFVDVPVDHVFYPEITWLASVGISVGWPVAGGAEYRPSAPVTRDVMAAFLHRLDGYLAPFTDVSSAQSAPTYNVFASDIAWLSSVRISSGWPSASGGNEYRPAAPVTRDVMSAFLYRLKGQPKFTPPAVSPFVDVPVTYAFYKEITWLAAFGVSVGWPISGTVNEFRPGAPVTRDVMATFLYRLAGLQVYEAPTTSRFVDVQVDEQFYKEISWLSEAGISEGWAVTPTSWEFRPTEPVTRDVMAAFLHRWQRHMTD